MTRNDEIQASCSELKAQMREKHTVHRTKAFSGIDSFIRKVNAESQETIAIKQRLMAKKQGHLATVPV